MTLRVDLILARAYANKCTLYLGRVATPNRRLATQQLRRTHTDLTDAHLTSSLASPAEHSAPRIGR